MVLDRFLNRFVLEVNRPILLQPELGDSLLNVSDDPKPRALVQPILIRLFLRVILTHLLHYGKVRLDLPPDHSVVVILAFVHFPQVKVLQCQIIIGAHLPIDALHVPCQLKLLLVADYCLSVFAYVLVAFSHHRIGKGLQLIVQVLMGRIPQTLEVVECLLIRLRVEVDLGD